jgi:hypothetical protein
MFTIDTISAGGTGAPGAGLAPGIDAVDPVQLADLVAVLGTGLGVTTVARLVVLAGFVVVTVVAVALADRPRIRRTYVAGFFVCLLVVNLIGVAPLPFMHWHKFSGERPEAAVLHEFRVVDAAGREIDYDHRATLSVDGFSMYLVTSRMDEYDEARRAAVAAYLLERANVYRASIESRSALHLVRFPPHAIEDTWDELELAEYDEFVGVRYYRLTLVTSADGTTVDSYSEELLGEWMPAASASASASTPATASVSASASPAPTPTARTDVALSPTGGHARDIRGDLPWTTDRAAPARVTATARVVG